MMRVPCGLCDTCLRAPANAQNASLQPYGFSAKERDASELMYFEARYYDPLSARFISPDPLFAAQMEKCIESIIECNLYQYTGNNPIVRVDLDGQQGSHFQNPAQYLWDSVGGSSWVRSTDNANLAIENVKLEIEKANPVKDPAALVSGVISGTGAVLLSPTTPSVVGGVAAGYLYADSLRQFTKAFTGTDPLPALIQDVTGATPETADKVTKGVDYLGFTVGPGGASSTFKGLLKNVGDGASNSDILKEIVVEGAKTTFSASQLPPARSAADNTSSSDRQSNE